MFKRGKSIPILGAFHGSDIREFFAFGDNPYFIGTDALGMFFSRPFAQNVFFYVVNLPRR